MHDMSWNPIRGWFVTTLLYDDDVLTGFYVSMHVCLSVRACVYVYV